MAASFHFQGPLLHNTHFRGQNNFISSTPKSSPTLAKPPFKNVPTAKFNIYEIMGGRGLCNGEEGLQQELKKSVSKEAASPVPTIASSEDIDNKQEEEEEEEDVLNVSDEAFEKELLGLTGGFPGGEKGLKKFIEENPSLKKKDP